MGRKVEVDEEVLKEILKELEEIKNDLSRLGASK
jgi:hypothetical protein